MAETTNQYLINNMLKAASTENIDATQLCYSNDSDSVGVAYDSTDESRPYVVYMTNERGQVEFTKRYTIYRAAVKFANGLYDDLCYMFNKIENDSRELASEKNGGMGKRVMDINTPWGVAGGIKVAASVPCGVAAKGMNHVFAVQRSKDGKKWKGVKGFKRKRQLGVIIPSYNCEVIDKDDIDRGSVRIIMPESNKLERDNEKASKPVKTQIKQIHGATETIPAIKNGKGTKKPRRKLCPICNSNASETDNPEWDYLISKYLTERGEILPRRITGICAKHQHMLSKKVKAFRRRESYAKVHN